MNGVEGWVDLRFKWLREALDRSLQTREVGAAVAFVSNGEMGADPWEDSPPPRSPATGKARPR